MKRIRLWLRELSLTQQLISIVFLIVVSLTVFIFSFITPSVNEFTKLEMDRMLNYSQEVLVSLLNENPGIVPDVKSESVEQIVQLIYDDHNGKIVTVGDVIVNEHISEEIKTILINAPDVLENYEYKSENVSSIETYLFTRLNDGRVLVSYNSTDFQNQLNRVFSNSLVNLNIIFSIFMFVVLTIWIITVIYPLNQIKNFITRIKNEEPAILLINRRDEIGEVADALKDMAEQVQKQNHEKQEMIQNISHDLKTPIATIKSYGEAIKDGIYPYGTLEKSIDVIIEHADRLEKKVRSLIALNKMDYLLDDCPPGDNLNMNEVIDKTLLSLKVIRPEITFESKLDRNIMFHGDEDPWRIVVENLVDNALRYAKSIIRIDLHPGELSVYNDGSSISQDRLEKLFKPYEKGTDGQFGLGLSIVYKIVTTYGYHVDAENLADGVRFRVWKELPKKEIKAIEKEKKKEERERNRERNDVES